jgi:4-hydroxy-4-methyl-2-oxoglutarate aldolase
MSQIDSDQINQFAHYGVATVYEAAGRVGLIDIPLHQIVPGSRAAGPACTVNCGNGDNLMVHAAMDKVQPGEILVVTMPDPQPVALIGELLATQAKVHQAAAILVDASVRDVDELRALGLPIWARWIRVRGATKSEIGTINEPVMVGGASIAQGDIVVLDTDGACVVAAERVATVLNASGERAQREIVLRGKLEQGAISYDLHGLRAYVEGKTGQANPEH